MFYWKHPFPALQTLDKSSVSWLNSLFGEKYTQKRYIIYEAYTFCQIIWYFCRLLIRFYLNMLHKMLFINLLFNFLKLLVNFRLFFSICVIKVLNNLKYLSTSWWVYRFIIRTFCLLLRWHICCSFYWPLSNKCYWDFSLFLAKTSLLSYI